MGSGCVGHLSVLLLAVAFVLNLRRPQYPDVGATTGELLLGLACCCLVGLVR